MDNARCVQINITGEAAQNFFRVDNTTIQEIVSEEILALISDQENIVKVIADIHIAYKWEYLRFIPVWLLCPIGAPAGKHIGEVRVVMEISNPNPMKYEGSARLEKMQGFYYGWKYDLPFGGGIIKYAIKDAIKEVNYSIGKMCPHYPI